MKCITFDEVPARELTAATMHGVTGRVVIGKADGADNFCMRVIEVAKGGVIPAHSHPWEHQQFVHSGQGWVECDGVRKNIGPGAVAFIPPNATHQMQNTGDEPLVFICLVPPAAPEL